MDISRFDNVPDRLLYAKSCGAGIPIAANQRKFCAAYH
jgi:hypothetical protein